MATSRSSAGVEVVGGGPATPEEVAAMAAAIEVVLGEPDRSPAPRRRAWRYGAADWRRHGLAAHPSGP
jgi:hypothetical protein